MNSTEMETNNNGVHQENKSGTNQLEIIKKSPKSPNNNKQKFKFGNYQNYYYKRLGSGEQPRDFRLELLQEHPEIFRGKKILDIGCNSGFVTINFAKQLLPASVLGIDIDESLVDKARKELEKEKSEGEFSERAGEALNHVIFRKANYILQDKSLLSFEKPQYDVVLCLSVTKWIHLNNGDDGIKFMFKRIFKQLNPKGILVLEAQAFATYKKRSKLSPEILENFKNIKLKPENFESYLLSDEVGFVESWCIADKEILKQNVQAKNFRRPLQVFVKS